MCLRTTFVFMVHFSAAVLGQDSANQCDYISDWSRRGTCRLGGCLGNEYRLPGEKYCREKSPVWAVFLCLDTLPCCFERGVCRNVCTTGESALFTATDCTASGANCCIPGEDGVGRQRELVARRQGVCGRVNTLGPRVLGGRVGQPRDWPWMVRLVQPARPDQGICAGVLVDDDTVLTVAHCVSGTRVGDLKVLLGDFDMSVAEEDEELADVRSIELNPNFVVGTRGNDLAVIKLARPVTFTLSKFPACLPDPDIPILGGASVSNGNPGGRGFDNASRCFIAGWGVTEDGRVSPKLRSAPVRLMDPSTCNAVLAAVSGDFRSRLPSDVICTDTSATNTDACLYDDGGMLVCLDVKNRYSLLGLVSEYTCGRLPAVFTRVSNYTLPVLSRL